jgi:Flp pilus assembly secretin CpaC
MLPKILNKGTFACHFLRKMILCVVGTSLLIEPVAAQDQKMQTVSLSPDKVLEVIVNPRTVTALNIPGNFIDIVVGDTSVVDVFPLTDNSVIGEVKVQVSANRGEETLDGLISSAVPGADISVSVLNNQVFVTGSVYEFEQVPVVLDIVQAYSEPGSSIVYSIYYTEISAALPISITRQGTTTKQEVLRAEAQVLEVPALTYGTIRSSIDGQGDADGADRAADEASDDQSINVNVNLQGAEPVVD